jgi:acyl-CoA reductase-like NAD-dependent aldehyde dehydrogenase
MSVQETIGQLGHLVDGEIVRGGQTLDVINPSSGDVAAHVSAADAALLDRALAAAVRAQPAWARDVAARRAVIRAMCDVIEANYTELDQLAAVEKGVPGAGAEFLAAIWYGRHIAESAIPADMIQDDEEKTITLVREPLGVVAAIAPWNAPGLIISEKIFSALLMGNTVVAKPSPFTPLATLRLARLWQEVVPPGVVNVLAGDDAIGAALVADPRVRLVSFTGSVEAGRSIAAEAGRGMKHVIAELGGNDAAIVLDDVDVKKAAPLLFNSAFILGGQACAAIKRLLVHEAVYEDLVGELAAIARATEVGPGTSFPPLVTRPQYERVRGLVADALDHGGKAVTGGAPLDEPGYYYPPTIVTGVGPGVRLVDEEQFGPVLPVIPFSDVEDAIAQANGTEYGLCASVWSRDIPRARQIASRLEAGTVLVNNHTEVAPHVPFGGCKASGIGRSGGQVGLDEYAELKTVIVYKDNARV